MKGFHSYEKMLAIALRLISPESVVEWGPGYSTEFIYKNSTAQIWTWENNLKYFSYYEKEWKKIKRIHLFFGFTLIGAVKKTPYVAAPLFYFDPGEVDLCFIDGRHRADTMIVAYHLLKPKGLLIVHDIYRAPLIPIREFFPHKLEDPVTKTGVYAKDQKVLEQFKKEFENE